MGLMAYSLSEIINTIKVTHIYVQISLTSWDEWGV